MVDLRQATEADAELAYAIKVAAFRTYVELTWGWDEQFQRDYHARDFKPANVKIITSNGVDVGWYECSSRDHSLYIQDFYILPEYQSRGIGSVALQLALETAASRNLPVRLGVLKVNPRAKALYERFGFVAVSETSTHILMEAHPSQSRNTRERRTTTRRSSHRTR